MIFDNWTRTNKDHIFFNENRKTFFMHKTQTAFYPTVAAYLQQDYPITFWNANAFVFTDRLAAN